MNKTINLSITQEDIDNGDRFSCASCPIALAVIRQEEAKFAIADRKQIIWEDQEGSLWTAQATEKTRQFMHCFDGLGPRAVEPITITLEAEQQKTWRSSTP